MSMKQLHQHLENNLSWYKKWHEHKHHKIVHYGALIVSMVFAVVLIVSSNPSAAVGNTYYIGPNVAAGAGAGTLANPWNIFKLETLALAPGDTVYLLGGTYRTIKPNNQYIQLNLQNISGTATNPIKIWAYQNEKPVFNFDNFTPGRDYIVAVYLTNVNYVHFKGLRITRLKQVADGSGISYGIRGEFSNNNIFEQLEIDHIGGGGIALWNSNNNLIKNTDVHHVDDRYSQGDNWGGADGIGFSGPVSNPNLSTGNTLDGVRLWMASDDGLDLFGHNGTITIKNSWSFWNGYYQDDNMSTRQPACTAGHCGNGGGFKLGPPGTDFSNQAPRRTIYNTLAFENKNEGFNQNSIDSHMVSQMFNNTAYKNGSIGFEFQYNNGSPLPHIFKNNISYDNTENIRYDNYTTTSSTNTKNSWNTGVATVNNADLQSISSVGMDGPRQANGDLPNLPFLKLMTGSDLIDKGIAITTPTIPFSGSFPDLGAFETGGATGDTTLPTVSITSPLNGQTFSGNATNTVSIEATASDNIGVVKVDFLKDNVLLGTDMSSPYSYPWYTGSTVNGTYSLTAKAYDAAGNIGISTITFTIYIVPVGGDTTPPSVSITSPTGGTVSGTTIISATASDNTGVTKVEFYRGTTRMGTDTSAPYSYSWKTKNNANGTYSLTAKAFDAAGNNATSAAVSVNVNNSVTPPSGSFTFQPFTILQNDNGRLRPQIVITSPNTITKVDFFLGTTLIGSDVSGQSPFDIAGGAGYVSTQIANGTYPLTTKAYDNLGNNATSSPLSVTINNGGSTADTTAPSVSITSPTGGTVSGTVSINATASDNVGVDHVDFYRGTTLIGADATSPYSVSWNTNTASTPNGPYSLTARAYDAVGNNTTSAAVSLNVNNVVVPPPGADTTPPTVSITDPLNGYTVSGTTVIRATASDNIGVTKVEFYRGTTRMSTDTSSPYSYSWNTNNTGNGTYSLTAKAFDAAGNTTISSAVSVTVSRDTTPPSVSITSPTGGTVSGTTTVEANASDNIGVTKVNFYRGNTLISTDTTSPYSISWDTTTVANGNYNLKARAYDAANNNTTSSTVAVTVNNTVVPPPGGTWIYCAEQGDYCNFSGTKEVRYGVNNIYFNQTLPGPVMCSDDVFGDPVYGTLKQCFYR